MKIAIIGNRESQNTKSWTKELSAIEGVNVINWSFSIPGRVSLAQKIVLLLDYFALKKWLRQNKPDIIIGYRLSSYGFLSALTGFRPLVVAGQGAADIWTTNPIVRTALSWMIKFTVKRADMIHCWAPHMVPRAIKTEHERNKVLVKTRGIDLTKFNLIDRKREQRIRMIVTRSLFSEYRHLDILKAVALVQEQEPDIMLCVAGKGPLKNELMNQCEILKIQSKVTFLGEVDHNDLPTLLKSADIYLSVPETEGASASLFESMACGCFPIVSDLPGNRHYITPHKKNGILVPLGDTQQLAAAVLTAIKDPEMRERAAIENFNYISEEVDAKKNIKIFVDHYRRLIDSRS